MWEGEAFLSLWMASFLWLCFAFAPVVAQPGILQSVICGHAGLLIVPLPALLGGEMGMGTFPGS